MYNIIYKHVQHGDGDTRESLTIYYYIAITNNYQATVGTARTDEKIRARKPTRSRTGDWELSYLPIGRMDVLA